MIAPWTLVLLLGSGVPALSVTLRGESRTPAGAQKRIAVLVTGVQRSFVLASKLRQIVPTSRALGYGVDFYVRLVQTNNGAEWRPRTFGNEAVEPLFRNVTDLQEYETIVRQSVGDAGAALEFFELLPTGEQIALPKPVGKRKRLEQYDPYTSPVGRNLLRRYASLETLARAAVKRFPYSFVLVTRDDDHFLGKLNISRFTSYDGYSNRVFSKDCKTSGGINDKTLLFGAAAANRTLLRLYSDFWMTDGRLNNNTNSEQFLNVFVQLNGAIPTPVGMGDLPSADSVWALNESGSPVLCQEPSYLCYDPDPWPPPEARFQQDVDRPNTCGSMQLPTPPP